ncbi:MAG: hypothetical protein NUV82_04290, partial [Candidatus Komeilibacteria bacterium]|nr:hypothetical protein [Candidatus Komeilibacteria bacterium]
MDGIHCSSGGKPGDLQNRNQMLLDTFRFYLRLRDRKDHLFRPLVKVTLSAWLPNRLTAVRLVLAAALFFIWHLAVEDYFTWESWHWYLVAIIFCLG